TSSRLGLGRSTPCTPGQVLAELQYDLLVIWGTDVVKGTCKEKFQRFVMKFIDPNANPNEDDNGVNPDEPL
ncbi:hypothetical protein LSH36_510g00019, partial [Paralvinella palmiformis]